MIAYLQQHQDDVWQLFLLHMQICGEALGIALLIALPLGILISRYHALYVPIIGLFGAIYTIPSLALFALLVPQFGITQVTALIALVVYAQFILIRNVATGLRGVDRAVIEAAAGMGMSPAQVLWKVELPLALPVIVAGLRIATVTVIAVATIATYISVHDLGDILSEGVSKGDNGEIEAGALAVGLLAVLADLLLRLLESRAARYSGRTPAPAGRGRRAAA
jgi:osmoprotectant transport system permease protein